MIHLLTSIISPLNDRGRRCCHVKCFAPIAEQPALFCFDDEVKCFFFSEAFDKESIHPSLLCGGCRICTKDIKSRLAAGL